MRQFSAIFISVPKRPPYEIQSNILNEKSLTFLLLVNLDPTWVVLDKSNVLLNSVLSLFQQISVLQYVKDEETWSFCKDFYRKLPIIWNTASVL